MFAVQFWVVADYTFCQAFFTVAIFALVAIKNSFSIFMMSTFILGYHGGCRVLKKSFCVKTCLGVSCPWSVVRCFWEAVWENATALIIQLDYNG